MQKSEVVGHLRRWGVWSAGRQVQRAIGAPTCASVHLLVDSFDARLFTSNVVLKHTYDRRLLYVPPNRIETLVKIGAWRKAAESFTKKELLQSWYLLGDGLKSTTRHVSRNFHGRFVADGDWDLQATDFGILPVVAQLFVEGRPPEQTDKYQRYKRYIESGRLAWTKGVRTIEELDEHFERLAEVYNDMRINGYRVQGSLGEDGSDEIRVCVDRHGRPCLYGGGTHRLSMAKLLRVETVPVVVKRVHSAWVDTCRYRYGDNDLIKVVARGLNELERRLTGDEEVPPHR